MHAREQSLVASLPYLACHDCIWYVMSILGMLFPYLVCYSHHGWSVQPLVALKKIQPDILQKKSEPPLLAFATNLESCRPEIGHI